MVQNNIEIGGGGFVSNILWTIVWKFWKNWVEVLAIYCRKFSLSSLRQIGKYSLECMNTICIIYSHYVEYMSTHKCFMRVSLTSKYKIHTFGILCCFKTFLYLLNNRYFGNHWHAVFNKSRLLMHFMVYVNSYTQQTKRKQPRSQTGNQPLNDFNE